MKTILILSGETFLPVESVLLFPRKRVNNSGYVGGGVDGRFRASLKRLNIVLVYIALEKKPCWEFIVG